jgi:ribosomal silencing factor RsfS
MDYYVGKFLSELRYNVEGMSATHWCIIGLMSVTIGIMYLRSSKNGR